MDRKTLLDHEGQWVHEPNPTRERLELLNPAECDLYHDLVEIISGPAGRPVGAGADQVLGDHRCGQSRLTL